MEVSEPIKFPPRIIQVRQFIIEYNKLLYRTVYEVAMLLKTFIRIIWRSVGPLWLTIAISLISSLFRACLFLNLEQNMYQFTNNIGSVIAIILDCGTWVTWGITTLEVRKFLAADLLIGRYSTLSYEIAWIGLSIGRAIIEGVIYVTPIYWIMYKSEIGTFENYVIFLSFIIMFLLIYELFVTAIIAYTHKEALAISTFVVFYWILDALTGFYVPKDQISVWIRWFVNLNPRYYTFEALSWSQFSDQIFGCPASTVIGNLKGICPLPGDFVLNQLFGFEDRLALDYAVPLIWILIMIVILMSGWNVYKVRLHLVTTNAMKTIDKEYIFKEIDQYDDIDDDYDIEKNFTIEDEDEIEARKLSRKKKAYSDKKLQLERTIESSKNLLNALEAKEEELEKHEEKPERRTSFLGKERRKRSETITNRAQRKETLLRDIRKDLRKDRKTRETLCEPLADLFTSLKESTSIIAPKQDPNQQKFDDFFRFIEGVQETFPEILQPPASISFDNISKYVGNGSARRAILKNVSGVINAGELCAIMGPSGSGKSSLLTAISTGDITKGKLYLNSEEYSGKSLLNAKVASFVKQFPVISHFLTVEEAMLFAAQVQLPDTIPLSIKMEYVSRIISLLNLDKVRNTIIGNEDQRGISGGQKRRVELAIDGILNTSRIMMLDEPTSGLSSTDSYTLIYVVQQLCKRLNYTVCCVIHQPRTSIWAMFDKLIVVTKGQLFYNGNTEEIDSFLTKTGHPLPMFENPADSVIDFASNKKMAKKIMNGYKDSQVFQNIRSGVEEIANKENSDGIRVVRSPPWPTSQFTQLHTLLVRSTLMQFRSFNSSVNFGIQVMGMALIFGFTFFQLDLNEYTILSNIGVVVLIIQAISVVCLAQSLSYIETRPLIYHERELQKYHFHISVFVDTLIAMVRLMVIAFLYAIIAYWLIGLNSTFYAFYTFTFVVYLLLLYFDAISHLFVYLFGDLDKVGAVIIFIYFIWSLSSGFLVSINQIPDWIVWSKWINPLYLALSVALKFQILYNGNYTNASAKEALDFFGWDTNDAVFIYNQFIILGFGFLFRALVVFLVEYNFAIHPRLTTNIAKLLQPLRRDK